MARLDHRHHAFIQALMTKGPISDSDAKALFQALFQQDGRVGDFSLFLLAINKEMSFLQMELRAGRNQYDGCLYYGLVNQLANDQAKMGTRYSPAQIAFFKAVLEAIISGPSLTGEISGIEALNLRLDSQSEQQSTPQEPVTQMSASLTLAQKEKTLSELAHDQWLTQSGGNVALGVRSFLELWNVFKNLDVPFCDVCNEAGIKAQECQNKDCRARMHDYCMKIKFHRLQVPRVCPKCGMGWGHQPASASRRDGDRHGKQKSHEERVPCREEELHDEQGSPPIPVVLSPVLKRSRSQRRSAFSSQGSR